MAGFGEIVGRRDDDGEVLGLIDIVGSDVVGGIVGRRVVGE